MFEPSQGNIQVFFDPEEPYIYVFTIPVLLLIALGLRKGALLYGVGALVFVFFLGPV